MIISEKMNDALNEQIGNEFSSSLQYVNIAAYFDSEALPELGKFFFRQSLEEREHAMRFVNFLSDAGANVRIPAIPEPQHTFTDAEAAVKNALDGEIEITKQINTLVGLAKEETDYTTDNFLQWFITEQLEEVGSMESLLKMVQRAADNLLHVEEYLRLGVRLTHPSSQGGS